MENISIKHPSQLHTRSLSEKEKGEILAKTSNMLSQMLIQTGFSRSTPKQYDRFYPERVWLVDSCKKFADQLNEKTGMDPIYAKVMWEAVNNPKHKLRKQGLNEQNIVIYKRILGDQTDYRECW